MAEGDGRGRGGREGRDEEGERGRKGGYPGVGRVGEYDSAGVEVDAEAGVGPGREKGGGEMG